MSHAGACIVGPAFRNSVPKRGIALIVTEPYQAFVKVARLLFPDATLPSSLTAAAGIAPGVYIHPTARVESDVTIEPGVVIGADAEIGMATFVGSGTVVGSGVRIGRGCTIGSNVSVSHALIGDRVTMRAGCRIGQDSFGYDVGKSAVRAEPHLGRVIIQDNVEVGSGTTIDRGVIGDTVIGEGAKIDNLASIANNAKIGRHCVIIAQAGVADGATLEDHVVIGARAMVAAQVLVGEGARVAAASVVSEEVPPAGQIAAGI